MTTRRTDLDRREFGKLLAAGMGGLALGVSGCATSAIQPDCRRPEPWYARNDPNSPEVIVIGAGLSGLIAAWTLLKGGKSVILLEAEDDVGGRMSLEYTDNHYALDMGGQWVGPTQRDMQALVIELGGIGYFLSYECGWSVQQWQGRRHGFDGDVAALLEGKCTNAHLPKPPETAACTPAPFAGCATETEDEKADRGLMATVWRNLMEIANKIDPEKPWNYKTGDLDNRTFASWLQEQVKAAKNPAKAYAEWLSGFQARTGGAGGFEPEAVSMLHMAWTQRVGAQTERPETWLLKGGAGQIPRRLENKIKGLNAALHRSSGQNAIEEPIRLNEAVHQVTLLNDGCFEVKTRSTKGTKVTCTSYQNLPDGDTYRCRDIIVAIPPPLRARIKFAAPKWATKFDEEISANVNFGTHSLMGSMTKVHLVYESAFWRHSCLSGSVVGKLEGTALWVGPTYCEFIADSSPPGGSPGVLTGFIAGKRNTEIEGWSPKEVKAQVLKEVCEYFKGKIPNSEDFRKFGPSFPGKDPEFFYRNWNTRPWTCGAFTSYLPVKTWTDYGADGWRSPVVVDEIPFHPDTTDRIFWAGTETSDSWPGYYDGAIRAGKSAAAGILGVKPDIYDPSVGAKFPEFSTKEGECFPPAGG